MTQEREIEFESSFSKKISQIRITIFKTSNHYSRNFEKNKGSIIYLIHLLININLFALLVTTTLY